MNAPQTAIVWADPHASSALDDVDAVRRVIRPDGTMWLYVDTPTTDIGTAWRFAFGLQARGWILRSDLIWVRMAATEVENAPARGHDYIFLMALKPDYYFDSYAVREESVTGAWDAMPPIGGVKHVGENGNPTYSGNRPASEGMRNRRSVWTPQTIGDLFEPMIRAGSSEGGCCSVCGAPLVRVIGKPEGRPDSWHGSKFDDGKNLQMHPNVGRRSDGDVATISAESVSGWRWSCDHHTSGATVVKSAVYVQGTMSYMAGWIVEGLHRRVVTQGGNGKYGL